MWYSTINKATRDRALYMPCPALSKPLPNGSRALATLGRRDQPAPQLAQGAALPELCFAKSPVR